MLCIKPQQRRKVVFVLKSFLFAGFFHFHLNLNAFYGFSRKVLFYRAVSTKLREFFYRQSVSPDNAIQSVIHPPSVNTLHFNWKFPLKMWPVIANMIVWGIQTYDTPIRRRLPLVSFAYKLYHAKLLFKRNCICTHFRPQFSDYLLHVLFVKKIFVILTKRLATSIKCVVYRFRTL